MNNDKALVFSLMLAIFTLINYALLAGGGTYNGIDLQFILYCNGLFLVPVFTGYISYKLLTRIEWKEDE